MRPLQDWGWTARFEAALQDLRQHTWLPARIVSAHRDHFDVRTDRGEVRARPSGRLRHLLEEALDAPAVGDWVAIEAPPGGGDAAIHRVLPRRTALVRKEAGLRTRGQVLAANLDTVFLITSLTREFNPRRIERMLAVVHESGADPVLVLNKADLRKGGGSPFLRAEAAAPGVPVHLVSALVGDGMAALRERILPGRTVVLLGSSGVGKSTLANRLLGERRLEVGPIREDDARGRHTTSHRQLVRLPGGGLLVDTPGLREVGLWGGPESTEGAFADIAELASECRFRDCRHDREPGCAVRAAVDAGRLDPARAGSLRKLRREAEYLERKRDRRSREDAKRRWKAITRSMRRRNCGR